MKFLTAVFLAIAFLFINTIQAQEKPLSTNEILKQASEQAAKENKNVFILFHASWCGWCHKMDTAMNDPSVKDFFEKSFVIKHLVVYESPKNKHLENPGSLDMLTKYKGNDEGIPYWMVFDTKGNMLADSQASPGNNTGCPATKEEVAHFIKVLQRTTSLNSVQLAVIEKRFLKNGQ
jgi:thioredoxin-related protein